MLWHWLQDAGLHGMGATGPQCLSWAELRAWSDGSGVCPRPWQASALRAASAAWVQSFAEATQADCPAPWGNAPRTAKDRQSVDNRLRGAFAGIATRSAPSVAAPQPESTRP